MLLVIVADRRAPMVDMQKVVKAVGTKRVLEDVTLYLHPGEILGLLGPNGAGKSTLMRVLLGTIRATSGSVRVFGQDPWKEGPAVRSRCSVVPEDDLFYDDETALSNLLLWADLLGLERKRALSAIEALASRFGFEDELHEKVLTLSKGTKRRLSIVRAFLGESELLLLDEPTSGLDIKARRELRRLIQERVRYGQCGAIVSSHELGEIRRLRPAVKVLVEGRIVEEVESRQGHRIEAVYAAAVGPGCPGGRTQCAQ